MSDCESAGRVAFTAGAARGQEPAMDRIAEHATGVRVMQDIIEWDDRHPAKAGKALWAGAITTTDSQNRMASGASPRAPRLGYGSTSSGPTIANPLRTYLNKGVDLTYL